jgi:2-hydroxy-6-oxonona-2,4-dienedioate hydrolase
MNSARQDTRTLFVDGRRVRCRAIVPVREERSQPRLRLPLLLIHGLGCSSEAWEPTLRCLQREGLDQPVWAPDMPGYGHSPGPREALGIDELADWSARLLDSLSVGRAHVAGNSMGCQVALALARRHPERLGRLTVVGPTTGARGGSLGRYLIRLLRDGCRESLRYNLTLLGMYGQMGFRRYLATLRKMMQDDPLAHAAEVMAPCLVVRGRADAIVPEPIAQQLAAALPAGSLAYVDGAAHAVQFTHPERFTAAAMAFLGDTCHHRFQEEPERPGEGECQSPKDPTN